MANPVGSKEQRAELRRRHFDTNTPAVSLAQIDAALAGLDIAQEMAEAVRAQTELMAPEGVMPCCDDCDERERKLRAALARWDNWQGA